jgi:YbgC/YbaW family acyl-CoA thioester hydrolase
VTAAPDVSLGAGEGPTAQARFTVSMAEVDLAHIHFAVYFRWMDAVHCQLLALLDHPLSEILRDGYATPAVDARCSYERPVTLDDQVTVRAWIGRVGNTSYTVSYVFEHDGQVVAHGSSTHAWLDARAVPVSAPVPDWIRSAMSI